jgi:hypothetical protein
MLPGKTMQSAARVGGGWIIPGTFQGARRTVQNDVHQGKFASDQFHGVELRNCFFI